jgi:hypothetical protein
VENSGSARAPPQGHSQGQRTVRLVMGKRQYRGRPIRVQQWGRAGPDRAAATMCHGQRSLLALVEWADTDTDRREEARFQDSRWRYQYQYPTVSSRETGGSSTHAKRKRDGEI